MAESRVEELRRRIARDPGSRLFAQLAEELRKEGELEEAVAVARAGLERHPTYPSARLTLGRALLDSGDPAAARAELEAAVRGAPDNILASRLLGEALETLGDLGAALLQYRATIQLAPGDRHVEARIRAIQERLGDPGAATPSETPPDTVEPTSTPGKMTGSEPGGGDLPPTIRIRMPGDQPGPPRAPLPPPAAASDGAESRVFADEPSDKETTVPPTPSRGEEGSVGETTAPRLPEAKAAPGGADEARAGRNLAPTERLPPPPEPPVSTPRSVPGAEEASAAGGEAGPGPEAREASEAGDERGQERDSDLAPTLPRSRAAEYAALDEEAVLPPTLPPGVVTGVEEVPPEDVRQAEASEGELEGGEGAAAVAPEEEAPATTGAVPDVEPTAEDAGASGPATARDVEAGQPASVDDGATGRQAPLSSATLAELYFQQGLLERALEVYKQVLEEDPANQGARSRLEEIEALVKASAVELPAEPAGADVDPATRRHALERAIERLEALLAVVRRR